MNNYVGCEPEPCEPVHCEESQNDTVRGKRNVGQLISDALMGNFSSYWTSSDKFFRKKAHTIPLGDEGAEFIALFDESERSNSFVHGADMFPGMIEGIDNYLKKCGKSFGNFKKIRFRETAPGDIMFMIEDEKNSTFEKNSFVTGEFTDNDGKFYYFYTTKSPLGRPPAAGSSRNILAEYLVVGLHQRFAPVHQLREKCQKYNYKERQQLVGLKEKETKLLYKQQMENNNGYIRSTIADMVNLMCAYKEGHAGLVLSYNDLSLSPDFSIEAFLEGQYSIRVAIVGHERNMGTQRIVFTRGFEIVKNDLVLAQGTVGLTRFRDDLV